MSTIMSEQEIADQIARIIAENRVALFMKGTPDQPRCGFSARVVQQADGAAALRRRAARRRV
jgi:monothiol glutaredoxin